MSGPREPRKPWSFVRDERLSRAIAAALAAAEAVELLPDERPEGVSEASWEAGCDLLVSAEGAARTALYEALVDAVGAVTGAVILPSGHVLAVSDRPDGLAIVPPGRVIRLE